MVSIKVKGGTPAGSDTLCRTCSYAHIIKGFRVSEEEIHCRYFYFERRIRFMVSECSFYEDKRLPSKKDMEEIAWILRTKKTGQKIGFVTPERFREIEGKDAEIAPAAAKNDKSKHGSNE